MRKLFLVSIAFSIVTQHSDAGPRHWIKTHKEELAQDFVVTAATGADAWTSINDQRAGGVIETDPLLGHHPSASKTIAIALAGTAIFDAMNYIISKREPHLAWFFVAPFAVSEGWEVHNNLGLEEK